MRSKLLKPEEVAEILGVDVSMLAKWRSSKKELDFVKVGRWVRYDPEVVRNYIAEKTVLTSEHYLERKAG